jgi:hypothetical protein
MILVRMNVIDDEDWFLFFVYGRTQDAVVARHITSVVDQEE